MAVLLYRLDNQVFKEQDKASKPYSAKDRIIAPYRFSVNTQIFSHFLRGQSLAQCLSQCVFSWICDVLRLPQVTI
jgi:hypothetical protein